MDTFLSNTAPIFSDDPVLMDELMAQSGYDFVSPTVVKNDALTLTPDAMQYPSEQLNVFQPDPTLDTTYWMTPETDELVKVELENNVGIKTDEFINHEDPYKPEKEEKETSKSGSSIWLLGLVAAAVLLLRK